MPLKHIPSYRKVFFEIRYFHTLIIFLYPVNSVLRTALNMALKEKWFSSLTINRKKKREDNFHYCLCGVEIRNAGLWILYLHQVLFPNRVNSCD